MAFSSRRGEVFGVNVLRPFAVPDPTPICLVRLRGHIRHAWGAFNSPSCSCHFLHHASSSPLLHVINFST